ncbi:MAG: NADH-quinone oxidoreductase subunit A [Burkholderiales bacterium]|nr:NADH-quinone oxidoreductase subunit A [Phycisphaerae bacterium]
MAIDLPLAQLASLPRAGWAPVALMILIGLGFAATTVIMSTFIGPGRTGPGKSTPYESGMNPIGDTHRRFNVRFYIVAMIYLVFDVGIVFLFPWASLLAPYSADPATHGNAGNLLLQMIVFVGILMVAYGYAWRKGVFKWD